MKSRREIIAEADKCIQQYESGIRWLKAKNVSMFGSGWHKHYEETIVLQQTELAKLKKLVLAGPEDPIWGLIERVGCPNASGAASFRALFGEIERKRAREETFYALVLMGLPRDIIITVTEYLWADPKWASST